MTTLALCLVAIRMSAASPIDGLLERIDGGASKKFKVEVVASAEDFFELDQDGRRVVVRGNSNVNIATGINWYLKYYAGVHLSWNGMTAALPDPLPPVTRKERRSTPMPLRYYLNYCTHSYSMAFWDWKRWEREIDWMALHGVNMPLALVGADAVWRGVLLSLGYTAAEADKFVAGPAFQAWWLMNNLEGWGGPNSDHWYESRVTLQRKILRRMRDYGMHPVLPGYSGMLPHDAGERLGLAVADPGKWNAFDRPAFLQPTDADFQRVAALYYKEMSRLFGRADFYSMDPFHEGGNTQGVDLRAAGEAIWQAMKAANPAATWVVQAWGANPRRQMMEGVPKGDLVVLDLYSESRPQWGDPQSAWHRDEGFDGHDWVFCMLLNFGGNVGLHGKMPHLIDEFYKARESRFAATMRGVGMTMEGIENNPVMYELLCELPWRAERLDKDEWLRGYVGARYGTADPDAVEAWTLLSNTIYNCPPRSTQQGTQESVFCARPSMEAYSVSTWSERQDYYDPRDVIRAAEVLLHAAGRLGGNNNYEYDLVDIVRQAVAEKGRMVYPLMTAAFRAGEPRLFDEAARRFLGLISLQDSLLAAREEFRLGRWLEAARGLGATDTERDHMEWNARVQITTWGDRACADGGGLHDYAHKEWNGLLGSLYLDRWRAWVREMQARMRGEAPQEIDFYAMEEEWTRRTGGYAPAAEGDAVEAARRAMMAIDNASVGN